MTTQRLCVCVCVCVESSGKLRKQSQCSRSEPVRWYLGDTCWVAANGSHVNGL